MRWAFRLGSLFGIPVYLHLTFLLLLGFVALAQGLQGGPAAAVGGLLFIAAIFGCVVLHELGHALAARQFGIRTRDVTLLPIGGVARLERMPDDPRKELWVALAGPAVNVALAGLLGISLFLVGLGGSGSGVTGSFAARLLAINLGLVAFNMLPAFPMDGGRVLRALLAGRMSYVRATETAARVGKWMALLFGIVGLLWNPMLIVIALFVWFGGAQEAEMVRRRAAFAAEPWIGHGPAGDDATDMPHAWPRAVIVRPGSGQGRFRRIGPWLVYEDD